MPRPFEVDPVGDKSNWDLDRTSLHFDATMSSIESFRAGR
jgi:hypothetical protein